MKIKLFPPQAIHELGQRANQEDALYPVKDRATVDDRLFLVCDGMGGHAKGEVASRTVATSIATYFKKNFNPDTQVLSDELLQAAIDEAYRELDKRDDGSFKKMGTTLTLICFHKGGATVAHIGDSRIYHLRPSTGEILYKSRDHSLVYELYQTGELSYNEMRTSPQKNVITRAMMPGEDNRSRADIAHITDIKAGDYFYHCSDGMLEQMEDEELLAILSATGSDSSKAQRLIDATVDNKDNHTAYILRVAEVVSESGDERLVDDEATAFCNAIRIERELGKDDLMDAETVLPGAPEPDPEPTHNPAQTPPAAPAPVAPTQAATAAPASAAPAQQPAPAPRRQGRGVPEGFDPNRMPPAPEHPSSKLPLILGILVALAVIAFAAWWFLLRDQGAPVKDEKPNTEQVSPQEIKDTEVTPQEQEPERDVEDVVEQIVTDKEDNTLPPSVKKPENRQHSDQIQQRAAAQGAGKVLDNKQSATKPATGSVPPKKTETKPETKPVPQPQKTDPAPAQTTAPAKTGEPDNRVNSKKDVP